MSTDEQRSLADYGATVTTEEPSVTETDDDAQRPAWTPGGVDDERAEMEETQTACQECGNAVSQSFARVFGDNEGIVHRCQRCGVRAGNARPAAGLDEITRGVTR